MSKLSVILRDILRAGRYKAWTGQSNTESGRYMCHLVKNYCHYNMLHTPGVYTNAIMRHINSEHERVCEELGEEFSYVHTLADHLDLVIGSEVRTWCADEEYRDAALQFWHDYILKLESKGE